MNSTNIASYFDVSKVHADNGHKQMHFLEVLPGRRDCKLIFIIVTLHGYLAIKVRVSC